MMQININLAYLIIHQLKYLVAVMPLCVTLSHPAIGTRSYLKEVSVAKVMNCGFHMSLVHINYCIHSRLAER